MLERQIESLARAGFQLLPAWQITNYYVVERDGFLALIERRSDGAFGSVGSPGILAEGSFAALVWKKEGPVFVSKGKESAASPEQMEVLQRFDSDLRKALEPQMNADERR